MTVLDFAKAIQRLVGHEGPIEFRPLPADDPKVRQPDITLARRLMGWEPKFDFEQGIAATVRYCRDFLAIPA